MLRKIGGCSLILSFFFFFFFPGSPCFWIECSKTLSRCFLSTVLFLLNIDLFFDKADNLFWIILGSSLLTFGVWLEFITMYFSFALDFLWGWYISFCKSSETFRKSTLLLSNSILFFQIMFRESCFNILSCYFHDSFWTFFNYQKSIIAVKPEVFFK